MAEDSLIPDQPSSTGRDPLPSAVPAPSISPEPSESQTLWRVVNDVQTFSGKKGKGKNNAAQQKQVGGVGTVVPVIYGTRITGAKIASVLVHNGALILLAVWCEGEVDAVEQVYVNNEPAPTGITITTYLGTEEQAADATLVAAWLAQGKVYADTLPGFCYSVVVVPPRKNTGFPQLTAKIRGRKVASSDGGAKAYSTTPAYIIADFIENTRFGLASAVNWSDVAAVAARNNETVDGEARHVLSASIDTVQPAFTVLADLCDYASCFVFKDGGTYRLIPDAPRATDAALPDDAAIVEGSLSWEQRPQTSAPTVMEVTYTDTSALPWKDASAFVYLPGVEAGTVERRVSRVQRIGITRHSEAYRYGVQRLNELTTTSLTMTMTVMDEGIQFLPGNVVEVTHPTGFTSKAMRVRKASPNGHLWALSLSEYDAAKYSDAVVTAPTNLDSALPSPFAVTAPTGFAAVEEVYQIQTGRFASRIVATWTGPTTADYIFTEGFTITITPQGGEASAMQLPLDALSFVSEALPEGVSYLVELRTRSEFASSDPASAEVTLNGKLALPSVVPSITAYSTNGETRIAWTEATDLDLTGYELRWSAQSGTWEAATHLAFVAAPALSFATTIVPQGDRRIWIKALDSVRTDAFPNGQESATAASYDFTATPNSTSNTDEHEPTGVTLTNMVAHGTGYITSFASDTFAALFASSLSTYGNALATYHTSGTSSVVTDAVDLLTSEATYVEITPAWEDLSGTGQAFIEHKVLVGDSWTRVNALEATVAARFFRWGVEATTTETIYVTDLGVLRATRDETENFIKHTVLNDAVAWML